MYAHNVKIALLRKGTVQTIWHLTKQWENYCGSNNWSFIKLTMTLNLNCLKANTQRLYNKLSCMDKCSYYPFSIDYELYTLYAKEIQDEHKRTFHFQNDTENKCDVLKTSYLTQSTEKLSKFCSHLTETRMCSASHTADIETIIQLVPNFVQCP
jgi:hypothetical protein